MKNNMATVTGYVNKKHQKNTGPTGVPGSDPKQFVYNMKCLYCGFDYKANGSDIWQRTCPKCQGGRP